VLKKIGPSFYIILALGIIIPFLALYAQFLQGVFFVVYPAVMALIYKRKGPAATFFCAAIGLALTWIVTYDIIMLTIMLCPTLLGLVLGHGFRIGKSFKTLLLRGTVVFILPILALICVESGSINDSVNVVFAESLETAKLWAEENPDTAGTFVADFSQLLDYTKGIFLRLIPAIAIISGLITCYLAIVLAKYFLKISGLRFVYVPSFAFLRLSRSMTIFMVLSSVLALLPVDEKAVAAFQNIAVIMLALAFFCGLSVVDFYVRQKISSGAARFLLYSFTIFIISIFSTVPAMMLCAIGVIDSFFKLRVVRMKEG